MLAGPKGVLLNDLASSSFLLASMWFRRGVGSRAICAANAAADETGGRPASRPAAAAWDDTRPGGSPKKNKIDKWLLR